jgi:molybdopterin molybdotransferase
MQRLLDVKTACEQILESIHTLPPETVPLMDAVGRILAQDIYADANLPDFDNSSMDGFAVRASDTSTASPEAPVRLRITMDVPAGANPSVAIQAGEAARIMTGAIIPAGADAVVPVENTDADFSTLNLAQLPEQVTITRSARSGDCIRRSGENLRKGQRALAAGCLIRPQEVGILAALGKSHVSVIRKPRVVILGSGDELLDIGQPLVTGKIHDSNSYMLEALVRNAHAEAIRLPIAPDDPAALRELFHTALRHQPDLIISSAGVSVGAADYVRSILDEMGSITFWKLNLRPGKPFAYGQIGGIPFFGLPGNPVSVMITFEVMVRPVMDKMAGQTRTRQTIQALAGEDIRSDGRLTYARVRIESRNDQIYVYETGTQSSGALMSMVIADALLIIPENVLMIEKGAQVTIQLLK